MFLDIALSLFSVGLISHLFDQTLSLPLIAVSVCFVLLPDIDVVSPFLKKVFQGKNVYNHRTFLHYPIVHAVIGIAITLFSPLYGVLYIVNTTLHFVHDTFFLGWGVVWLWPFKETRYKCFPDRDGKITNISFISWEKKDDEALMKRYHNPHWIRDFYFRPNIVAYIEYITFICALAFLFIFFR